MTYVTLAEAREKLEELVEATENGSQVVITKDGKPVALLRATSDRRSGFGVWKGRIKMSDDFDEPLDDFAEGANDEPTSLQLHG